MNYCLEVLEQTNLQPLFDLRNYEKYMLLGDTCIEPIVKDCPPWQSGLVTPEPECEIEYNKESEVIAVKDNPSDCRAFEQSNDSLILPESESKPVGRAVIKPFTPRYQNTLFWCFFIHHFGMAEYEMIGARYQNAELEEKYRISETLEKNPGRLKATNYSPSKQSIKELCATIASSTRDDFFSLIAFSAYYKTNTLVVFEHSRTYLEFNCGDDEATNMIIYAYKSEMGAKWLYSVMPGKHNPQLKTQLESEYVKMNTYVKPLKGISSYKSDELIEMAEKMQIEMDQKDGKKELFEKIGQKIGVINT